MTHAEADEDTVAAALRVLLIEDNPADARLVRHMCSEVRGTRFTVTHRTNLAEGLAVLAEAPFDVVLLDLTLPDSAGMETVERFTSAAPELPVVVLTGLDEPAAGRAAVRVGAEEYLVKGHGDADVLGRAVVHALERRTAHHALRGRLRRLEAMLAGLDLGVAGIDGAGLLFHCNPAFAALLEQPVEAVTGRSWRSLRGGGDAICPVAAALQDSQPRRNVAVTLLDGNGAAVPVRIGVAPLEPRDPIGVVVSAVPGRDSAGNN